MAIAVRRFLTVAAAAGGGGGAIPHAATIIVRTVGSQAVDVWWG